MKFVLPRRGLIVPILLVVTLVAAPTARAADVTLAWDASTSTNVTGYRLYYGTASHNYTKTVDAGKVTTYALTALAAGTYYFSVTAYNSSGLESAYSNEVSAIVATASDTQKPVISSVASSSISSSGATITWTTSEPATSQVEYGTSTAYGKSTTLDTVLRTAHSVTISGLTAGTTYHCRTRSADAAGNLSLSADFTVTTLLPTDTTKPVISAVASSSITSSSAAIAWTTNETSDSQVEYGTTTAYGKSTTLSTTRVTAHSQSVAGLTAKTIYHYRVKSKDAAGNQAISGDFTFTTAAATDTTKPVISAVASSSITSNSARITWTTNEASDSLVEYGTTTVYGKSTTLATTLVTSHSQALSSLTAKTTYHYRVKSKDAAGNQAVSVDYTFTTAAATDTTKPVISAVASSSITSGSAKITWTTNEAADSLVEYGTTTVYGKSTTLATTLVTSHSQALSSLTAKTTYHYRVKSKDAAGNQAVSVDYTFTTAASDTTPPVISAVSASATNTGATVKWTTNEPADSQVQYGTSTSYGSSTTVNTTMSTSHSVGLSGLTAGKTYHYRVKSKDAAGNLAVSADYTFSTSSYDITTGLVAAFGFDEGTGSTTADLSPNANVATLYNATWTSSGRQGKALAFNGTTSFLSSTLKGMPALNAPKTVACWLYLTGTATHSAVTMANPTAYASAKLGIKGSTAGVRQYDGTMLVGASAPAASYWHFYAWVFDGSVNRLYIDGVLSATSTVKPKTATVTKFEIGRSNPAGEYFKGLVDEVRVYSRALTQTEVMILMTTPVYITKGMAAASTSYAMEVDRDASADAVSMMAVDAPSTESAALEDNGAKAVLGIGMTRDSYGEGDIVTVGSCWVSNPATGSRNIEPKFWIEPPGLPVTPVIPGDVVSFPPRHDEDYAPVPLFEVDGSQPAGRYRLGGRLVDAVTGDMLSEQFRSFTVETPLRGKAALPAHVALPEATLEPSGEFGLMNAGAADAAFEVKMWLESPGQAPIALLSVGADGTLVLAPGEATAFDPLAGFEMPVGDCVLRARVLDPNTGAILSERAR